MTTLIEVFVYLHWYSGELRRLDENQCATSTSRGEACREAVLTARGRQRSGRHFVLSIEVPKSKGLQFTTRVAMCFLFPHCYFTVIVCPLLFIREASPLWDEVVERIAECILFTYWPLPNSCLYFSIWSRPWSMHTESTYVHDSSTSTIAVHYWYASLFC